MPKSRQRKKKAVLPTPQEGQDFDEFDDEPTAVDAYLQPYREKYGPTDPSLPILEFLAFGALTKGTWVVPISEVKTYARLDRKEYWFQSKVEFHLKALVKKGAIHWQEGDTTCRLRLMQSAQP